MIVSSVELRKHLVRLFDPGDPDVSSILAYYDYAVDEYAKTEKKNADKTLVDIARVKREMQDLAEKNAARLADIYLKNS
jgi:hypothetical protein